MSPFLTWLLSLLGPALLEAVKDWLKSLFQTSNDPAFYSMPRSVQVMQGFAGAINQHHADGDKLKQQRAGLRWYQFGARLNLSRDIGRHERRTRLLVQLRDVALQAAREGRYKLRDDEAEAIAVSAEAAV